MSVLFQALNKAARENRKRQSPLIVPLLSLPVPSRSARWMGRAGLASFLVMAVCLTDFSSLTARRDISLPDALTATVGLPVAAPSAPEAPEPVTAIASDPAPLAYAPEPAAAVETAGDAPPETTDFSDEPLGIALPAEDLAPPEKSEEEIARQIEGTSVLAKGKDSTPRIVVSEGPALSANALMKEAHNEIAAKNYAVAIARYDRILSKDENHPEAWEGKLYALQQTGSREAQTAIERMIAQRPLSAPAHAALGQMLTERNETQQALAAWRRALELDPANDGYRLSLAILYDRTGQDAGALDLYRQLPPPLSPAIQQRLDYLAARQGEPLSSEEP